jgi:uncharacterized protein (TIGR02453 family)
LTPTPYFTPRTFHFLKDLAANNRRDWFADNKARYEDHVKVPALRFIQDFQDELRRLSPHFAAGPRALFRIHRDTRFAKDKSPYKTHTGIHFRHDHAGDVHAPGYYVHIEPGACFVGLGIWHPDGPTTRRIREAIVEDPAGWKKAAHGKGFTSVFTMSGDRLTRAPRGFDPEHALVEDLKWKDYTGGRGVPQSFVTAADLPTALAGMLAAGSPFMAFLCKAAEVPF